MTNDQLAARKANLARGRAIRLHNIAARKADNNVNVNEEISMTNSKCTAKQLAILAAGRAVRAANLAAKANGTVTAPNAVQSTVNVKTVDKPKKPTVTADERVAKLLANIVVPARRDWVNYLIAEGATADEVLTAWKFMKSEKFASIGLVTEDIPVAKTAPAKAKKVVKAKAAPKAKTPVVNGDDLLASLLEAMKG